jgi:hypothetical protein
MLAQAFNCPPTSHGERRTECHAVAHQEVSRRCPPGRQRGEMMNSNKRLPSWNEGAAPSALGQIGEVA